MFKRIIFIFVLLITLSSCSSNIKIITDTSSITTAQESSIEYNNNVLDTLDYEESKDVVINPGQGFYKTYPVKLTLTGLENNITWLNDSETYHVRVGLGSYSSKMGGSDIDINETSLNSLDEFLTTLDDQGAGIIIRFAYDDFSGLSNMEPSIDLILSHIKSIGKILDNHTSIEAIECGLIGPWGEMHTSQLSSQDTYNKLLSCWLDNTSNFPILARKPEYIYKYMGYTVDTLSSFKYTSEEYKRLGVFNDGYLGTSSDTGTYINREVEVNWMNEFLTTPYGGEVINPDSELTYIPLSVDSEQYKTHLSYLNSEWNDEIIARWQNTTITDITNYSGYNLYNYMNNHMGYGFLITNVSIKSLDNTHYINIDIDKLGYAYYNSDISLSLILIDESNNQLTYEIGQLDSDNISYSFNEELSGDYTCYLKLIRKTNNLSYKLLNNTYSDQFISNFMACLTF